MVISDVAPVWSNLGDLGQSGTVAHRNPGMFHNLWCPADAFEEECQNPDNPFGGGALELFGLGVPPDYGTMGQGVMFPEIKRANVAINPLSDLAQNRVPDTAEFSDVDDLGQMRIPDMQQSLGQGVMFPEIKRANVAINPLSGIGTVRISDDSELVGLDGDATPKAPEVWGLVAAAVLYFGGVYGLKGEIGSVLKHLSYVVGGFSVASYIGQVAK